MVDDDPEIERSPLSREFSLDGVTVNVEIYRLKGGDEGWSLEVVDHKWASTVWDDLFATDQEAPRRGFAASRSCLCLGVSMPGLYRSQEAGQGAREAGLRARRPYHQPSSRACQRPCLRLG
jgi:hypothetical protein